ARHGDHVQRLEHERVLAAIAPRDLEAAGQAEKALDRVEMAVQAGTIAGLALSNADDQAARALDRRAGAATLVIRRRHHRIDFTRRHFFHRARRNVVRLEILRLVGLKLVESSDTGFHLFAVKRLCSHSGPPNSRVAIPSPRRRLRNQNGKHARWSPARGSSLHKSDPTKRGLLGAYRGDHLMLDVRLEGLTLAVEGCGRSVEFYGRKLGLDIEANRAPAFALIRVGGPSGGTIGLLSADLPEAGRGEEHDPGTKVGNPSGIEHRQSRRALRTAQAPRHPLSSAS